MRIISTIIGATGLSLAACASLLAAQQTATDNPDTTLVPFAVTDFAGYLTPDECAWDQQWSENVYWRDKRRDTVVHTAAGNQNQPVTQHNIGTCAVHFVPGTVAERDLIGVAQAALADNQDAQATAAIDRLLKLAGPKDVFDRAWWYYEAANIYLSAPQPRLEPAAALITKLDAMGAPAAVARMLAHTDFGNEGARRDSIPLWDRELNAALAASKEIAGDMHKQFAFEAAEVYLGIASLRERQNDVAGAKSILAAGRAELVPLRPKVVEYFDGGDTWVALQGKTPGPLVTTRWVNGGPDGTVYPRAGKPTLLAFVSANCGGRCYEDYAVLRRIAERFPNNKLDVILVTHTDGWSRGQLVSPDSEINITQDYFQNFLHFPAIIAEWKGVYQRRSDGALILDKPPLEKTYDPPHARHITVGLIDSHGVLRLYTTLASGSEISLNNVLQSMTQ